MATSVFEFGDYKKYLGFRLPTKGPERGVRARLASSLKCQPAFVSQVLTGKTHFSLEHAILVDDYLGHTEAESEYFLLLVHQGRAGSVALRKYYEKQLSHLRKEHRQVSRRVQVSERLSAEASHQYYSAWYYAAIHVLISVPQFRDKKAISERLMLPLRLVTETLDFLIAQGLAIFEKGQYTMTSRRVHLGNDSSMIHKHHTNWRIRGLHSLEVKDPLDLHYSGPIAISQKNAEKLRGWLLEWVEKTEPILAEPSEEDVFGVALDLFRL